MWDKHPPTGGCSEAQYPLLTMCRICLSSRQRRVWKDYCSLEHPCPQGQSSQEPQATVEARQTGEGARGG